MSFLSRVLLGVKAGVLYLLIHPAMPAVGDPRRAQVILVQGYGRNDIPDSELYKIGSLYEKVSQNGHRVVKTLALTIDPGQPNYELAEECRDLMDKYGLPAIVQWEVAIALYNRRPLWYEENASRITSIFPPSSPQKRFGTRSLKLICHAIMQKNGWQEAIEVAHARMAVRAFLIVWKILGRPPIIVPQKSRGFDRRSVQCQTRTAFTCFCYEVAARAHHLLHRWIF